MWKSLHYSKVLKEEVVESVELDGPVRGESDEPDEEFLPGDSIKRNQTNESQPTKSAQRSYQLPVTERFENKFAPIFKLLQLCLI